MVEWKMIVLVDVEKVLTDDGLVLNSEMWMRGW